MAFYDRDKFWEICLKMFSCRNVLVCIIQTNDITRQYNLMGPLSFTWHHEENDVIWVSRVCVCVSEGCRMRKERKCLCIKHTHYTYSIFKFYYLDCSAPSTGFSVGVWQFHWEICAQHWEASTEIILWEVGDAKCAWRTRQ